MRGGGGRGGLRWLDSTAQIYQALPPSGDGKAGGTPRKFWWESVVHDTMRSLYPARHGNTIIRSQVLSTLSSSGVCFKAYPPVHGFVIFLFCRLISTTFEEIRFAIVSRVIQMWCQTWLFTPLNLRYCEDQGQSAAHLFFSARRNYTCSSKIYAHNASSLGISIPFVSKWNNIFSICGKRRSWQVLLKPKKKIRDNHARSFQGWIILFPTLFLF